MSFYVEALSTVYQYCLQISIGHFSKTGGTEANHEQKPGMNYINLLNLKSNPRIIIFIFYCSEK